MRRTRRNARRRLAWTLAHTSRRPVLGRSTKHNSKTYDSSTAAAARASTARAGAGGSGCAPPRVAVLAAGVGVRVRVGVRDAARVRRAGRARPLPLAPRAAPLARAAAALDGFHVVKFVLGEEATAYRQM